MALDLYICGPGFGETILLRWEENGKAHAALVDGYSPSKNVAPLLRWFEKAGVDDFSFIAVTHPHLDHLRNLDATLRAFAGRIDRLWRWPGLDEPTYIAYFNKLARKFPHGPNKLSDRARAVSGFFEEWERQFYVEQRGKPEIQAVDQLHRIYPVTGPSRELEIKCISPWDEPTMQFLNIVTRGITPGGEVTDTHREANLVSNAFIIQYGRAQILLGGDMEDVNWNVLRNCPDCPELRPCVVKVSHHGSSSGRIDGMWGADGFLGRYRPITVITPWRNAGSELPDPSDPSVTNEILSSGCEAYVTGQQRPRTEDRLSHIHIRVDLDGNAQVVFKSPTVKRLQKP